MLAGQQSLRHFYESVKVTNPRIAAVISSDVVTVSMIGLAKDKTGGREAADRIRHQTRNLPEIQRRVLEGALYELLGEES